MKIKSLTKWLRNHAVLSSNAIASVTSPVFRRQPLKNSRTGGSLRLPPLGQDQPRREQSQRQDERPVGEATIRLHLILIVKLRMDGGIRRFEPENSLVAEG